MSNETEFVNGLSFKPPHDNAPEYVKAKGWMRIDEMIAFLQARKAKGEDSLNFDVKVSSGGKWYAAVDNWKPEGNGGRSGNRGGAPHRERPQSATKPASEFTDEDIPFATNRSAW